MPLPQPTRRRFLAGSLAVCWSTAQAAPLAAPSGPVVLSISGRINRSNAPGRADFDLAMLAALPQHEIVTHTPWHSGVQSFSGPLLREVLAQAGAGGRMLVATALNDYRCEI